MSMVNVRNLWCDMGSADGNCPHGFKVASIDWSVAKVRREAKAAGWERKGDWDVCPDHAATRKALAALKAENRTLRAEVKKLTKENKS